MIGILLLIVGLISWILTVLYFLMSVLFEFDIDEERIWVLCILEYSIAVVGFFIYMFEYYLEM